MECAVGQNRVDIKLGPAADAAWHPAIVLWSFLTELIGLLIN